jgi:ferredoxin
MIANYGYEDGSGFYYVTIDTDRCVACESRGCAAACPGDVFIIEMDDYDDVVAAVAVAARKRLRELCAACKARNGGDKDERLLPCTSSCPRGAIRHSW